MPFDRRPRPSFRAACAAVLAAGCCVLAAATPASAAPAAYHESTGGDLPISGSLPVIPFDVGVNTVSGTLGAQPSDWDSFAFLVPGGTEVTLVRGQMFDSTGDMTYVVHLFKAGSSTNTSEPILGSLKLFSPGTANLAQVPIAAGTYLFQQNEMASMQTSSPTTTAGYTYSFTVAPVPEPAALALLALAAPALLARRRR